MLFGLREGLIALGINPDEILVHQGISMSFIEMLAYDMPWLQVNHSTLGAQAQGGTRALAKIFGAMGAPNMAPQIRNGIFDFALAGTYNHNPMRGAVNAVMGGFHNNSQTCQRFYSNLRDQIIMFGRLDVGSQQMFRASFRNVADGFARNLDAGQRAWVAEQARLAELRRQAEERANQPTSVWPQPATPLMICFDEMRQSGWSPTAGQSNVGGTGNMTGWHFNGNQWFSTGWMNTTQVNTPSHLVLFGVPVIGFTATTSTTSTIENPNAIFSMHNGVITSTNGVLESVGWQQRSRVNIGQFSVTSTASIGAAGIEGATSFAWGDSGFTIFTQGDANLMLSIGVTADQGVTLPTRNPYSVSVETITTSTGGSLDVSLPAVGVAVLTYASKGVLEPIVVPLLDWLTRRPAKI